VAAPIPVKSYCILLIAKKFSCYETQQLILGTGTAIWWVTEPHLDKKKRNQLLLYHKWCCKNAKSDIIFDFPK
jgi:hypothetical protein